MQINDLSDAIIHAQQDIGSGGATLINILSKITSDSQTIEDRVTATFTHLQTQAAKLPFAEPLQSTINAFNSALIATVFTPPKPTT